MQHVIDPHDAISVWLCYLQCGWLGAQWNHRLYSVYGRRVVWVCSVANMGEQLKSVEIHLPLKSYEDGDVAGAAAVSYHQQQQQQQSGTGSSCVKSPPPHAVGGLNNSSALRSVYKYFLFLFILIYLSLPYLCISWPKMVGNHRVLLELFCPWPCPLKHLQTQEGMPKLCCATFFYQPVH